MAHSHCPPMDYTEATLKLGGGKNGAFSFSSHGLQPKVVSHDKVASNRKSTTNFIFIHYRQNFQWVDAPLRLGVAGMAHSQFFLPTMDCMQGPSPVAKWLIEIPTLRSFSWITHEAFGGRTQLWNGVVGGLHDRMTHSHFVFIFMDRMQMSWIVFMYHKLNIQWYACPHIMLLLLKAPYFRILDPFWTPAGYILGPWVPS